MPQSQALYLQLICTHLQVLRPILTFLTDRQLFSTQTLPEPRHPSPLPHPAPTSTYAPSCNSSLPKVTRKPQTFTVPAPMFLPRRPGGWSRWAAPQQLLCRYHGDRVRGAWTPGRVAAAGEGPCARGLEGGSGPAAGQCPQLPGVWPVGRAWVSRVGQFWVVRPQHILQSTH